MFGPVVQTREGGPIGMSQQVGRYKIDYNAFITDLLSLMMMNKAKLPTLLPICFSFNAGKYCVMISGLIRAFQTFDAAVLISMDLTIFFSIL